MIELVFDSHSHHLTCWPVLILVSGEHECTGEPGGLMIALDFLYWSAGIQFT